MQCVSFTGSLQVPTPVGEVCDLGPSYIPCVALTVIFVCP